MRILTLLILVFILTNSQGQSILTERTRFLTYSQNRHWLETVKKFDKSRQWTEIKLRYFSRENSNTPLDTIQYSPLIVVNGVPLYVPDNLTEQDIKQIMNLLNGDSINQISVIDEQPEGWTFGKPFAGVILLTVDERTHKKLFKLRLQ